MDDGSALENRSVLVTGASRGLGRAMAIGLLKAGARVALACRGSSRPLETTLELAAAAAPPSRFTYVFGDLRDPADCERIAAQAAAALGSIDALVNNAAIPNTGEGAPFWRIALDDWAQVSRTNCDSVFLMSRALAPAMIERGFGRIVNISTSERTMARPRFSPYGPSKAFVEACTRMWAAELNGTGVTMNALIPGGAVDTAADVAGVRTMGKSFLPASIMVPSLVWLLSDASNGVTGERFAANLWDEDLPLQERIATARQSGADLPRIM